MRRCATWWVRCRMASQRQRKTLRQIQKTRNPHPKIPSRQLELRRPMTIAGYHAHLYFSTANPAEGAAVQQQVRDGFGDTVTVGRFHAVPVGPHPIAMFQIAFLPAQLEPMVA